MQQPLPISHAQLVDQLEFAMQKKVNREEGFFGPDSMMWHIGKESAAFLGAGRAALLQLAHPWVANSIDQLSATRNDPLGRFRRTFINVFTMLYGSVDQVVASAMSVHQIHTKMQGKISEDSGAFKQGSSYMANEANAMLWVHATLWDTMVRMYELTVQPLSREQKEQLYLETKFFAYCFGISDDVLPPNWHEFQEYCDYMYQCDILTVKDTGREMGDMLFEFDLPGAKWPLHWLRIITAEMMPERLREEFGLPEANDKNKVTFNRSIQAVRLIYPRLPKRVRYIPAYVEARRRIAGKQNADLLTKGLNKVWVGRPVLVSTNK